MRCIATRVSRWRRGQLPLVVLLAATPLRAEQAQPSPVVASGTRHGSSAATVTVAWPDLVRLVDRHPELSAGRFAVEAARAGVRAAGAVPNPVLEGSIGRGLARTGGDSRFEWGLALTMPLTWLAQRGSRLDAAEAEVEVAQAESTALRRDVLLQLRVLFLDLVHAQSQVVSLEALEAETAGLVGMVSKRVAQGEARPVEATRVEIELQKVRSELEVARASLTARRDTLALWLDVPTGTDVVARAELSTPVTVRDRDMALAKARASHPATALAQVKTRALDAEVKSAKSTRVPSVSVTGFTTHELDRRAYGAGFTLDLPLWNWSVGPVAEAKATRAMGHELARAATLEIETAVLNAHSACQAAVATAQRFGTELVPRSESAAATTERTYQLGETSLLEVIDARRTLLEVRRLHLDALVQAQLDCGRLDLLVGDEPR